MDELAISRAVAAAEKIADSARSETLPRWRSALAVTDKGGGGDFDPVTDADREAERAMRSLISRLFPDHRISGEEFEAHGSAGRCEWSLDPIDGTRSYLCGLPNWVTLIALLDEGHPVLGLIDAPCLEERYIADGDTAWMFTRSGKARIRSSACTRLADARFSTTDPYLFAGEERAAVDAVRQSVKTTRFGQDGYAYARLAAGTIDLVIESGLKPHDYHALIPVVRGSGGMFGDWAGGEDFAAGKVIAAATSELYKAAVAIMRSVG